MAERFERLYKLPENLYIDGAPIIISAGALLKDTATGSVVTQLKFHSVTKNIIKAVKISLCAYDVSGSEIEGIKDYQYLDLSVHNGQEFGSNKAIVLPSAVTRSFSISDIIVVFSDDNQWKCENAKQLKELPAPMYLSAQLHNAEFEKQYKIFTTTSALYVPTEEAYLWDCTCGEWNVASKCTKCGCSKQTVFSALNIEMLQIEADKRSEAEQVRKEEQKRIAEAEKEIQQRIRQERTVKNKKNIKLFSFVAFIAIIIFIGASILISNIKYDNAISKIEECINNNQFETAFDYVVGENIKEHERNKYLEIVIPKMKEQFAETKEADVVLVFDNCSIIKEGRTLYLKNGDNTIEIYTLPEDTVKYGDKFGSYGWESGSRYELEETYMYAGGYVLFAEHSSTILPHDSKWKYHFEMDTTIMAYDINRNVCKTLLIKADDPGMAHFVKLIDGRIILNVSGAYFNPYTGDVQEESNLISKKDEDDYIYPYEYEYSVDYIYSIE